MVFSNYSALFTFYFATDFSDLRRFRSAFNSSEIKNQTTSINFICVISVICGKYSFIIPLTRLNGYSINTDRLYVYFFPASDLHSKLASYCKLIK